MHAGMPWVEVKGEASLVARLEHALQDALGSRHRRYLVNVNPVGRVGEVLVAIDGSKGRLPMILGHEDLEPGYVRRVVREVVDRFAL